MGKPIVSTAIAAMAAWGAVVAVWALIAVPGSPDLASDVSLGVIGLLTCACGVAIAWRAQQNPVGLIVTVIGALQTWLLITGAWYWVAVERPDALPRPTPLFLAVNATFMGVLFVLVGVLVLVFPGGHVRTRGARWLIVALALGAVAFMTASTFSGSPNSAPYENVPPFAPATPLSSALMGIAIVWFFACLILCFVLTVRRVARSSGVERAQLQWALLGSSVFLLFPIACGTEVLLTGAPQWPSLVIAYAGTAALPVGITVAMLRHDLFDVDRAVSAWLTYLAVITVLAVGFTASIAVGGALFGSGSPWVAASATALCAVALLPLYRVVRRAVDRRFYPLRRAALLSMAALQARVISGTAQPEELAEVLSGAIRDPDVVVGYALPGSSALVDGAGELIESADADALVGEVTPIEAAGECIGVLKAPSLTSPLRRELAVAAAPLVSMVCSRLELSVSLREVEASRSRIVAAEDAARRRFERDLHDGAQQRLVSLGMSLRLAQRHLDDGTVDVDALLDESVAQLTTAVAELRRLAHGMRPSVLDDGLTAALTTLARSVPLPIDLHVDDTDVPSELATTAYYVVAESVVNAVKHAHADGIRITLRRVGDRVRVSVQDDGCGGADASLGSGIAGLSDRVAAAGGQLRLVSQPSSGTLVEAELPCAS